MVIRGLKHSLRPELRELVQHSDRFVVRNSFSLCENKNKLLAGAMLRISDMWFPV